MKQSPNQKRASTRNWTLNGLTGGIAHAKNLISRPDVFSDREILIAEQLIKWVRRLRAIEPSNYISTRYPKEES